MASILEIEWIRKCDQQLADGVDPHEVFEECLGSRSHGAKETIWALTETYLEKAGYRRSKPESIPSQQLIRAFEVAKRNCLIKREDEISYRLGLEVEIANLTQQLRDIRQRPVPTEPSK